MIRKPKQGKALWWQIKNPNPHTKVRKPVRRVSKVHVITKREYKARAKVWKKGKSCWCFGCHTSDMTPICNPLPHECTEVHHFRGRGRGGRGPLLMDERFWIPCCEMGHSWIHANPAEARKIGLLCQEGDWNKPVKP